LAHDPSRLVTAQQLLSQPMNTKSAANGSPPDMECTAKHHTLIPFQRDLINTHVTDPFTAAAFDKFQVILQ
jgi:hypothetical protein